MLFHGHYIKLSSVQDSIICGVGIDFTTFYTTELGYVTELVPVVGISVKNYFGLFKSDKESR